MSMQEIARKIDRHILCENSKIILRKAIDGDKEPYYQLKREYAYMKSVSPDRNLKMNYGRSIYLKKACTIQ